MRWIVPLIIGLCLAGCGEQKTAREDVKLIESGMSIYQLERPWTDQSGDTVYLEDLAGEVVVSAMIYTSCDVACPRIVSDLKRIEGWAAGESLEDDVHFLLVSFDPKIDTPEKLRQFASESGLDAEKWTLLHGNDDQILELAAVLNVKYKRTNDVHFAHSNILHVLNQQGELVYQKEGFDTDLSKVEAAILKLVSPT